MTTHASETDQQSARDRAAQVGSTAKEQTGQVAGTAKEQAAGVAGTAKEQAVQVAQEAAGQARNLFDELRSNVRQQVGGQRDQLAEQLDRFGAELRQMAERSDADGPATEAVRQVAARIGDLKDYLRGGADVAGEVRRFARRRPGTFLLACAAAGVLAGRATRGAAAARRRQQGAGTDLSPYRTGVTTGTGPMYSAPTAAGVAGTAAGAPLAGVELADVERTSDPNVAPTTGPLVDQQGYGLGPADPVPPGEWNPR